MTIQDAKDFIGYNIKEGVYDPEQFEGWADAQLIEFAEHEEGKAQWMADQAYEMQEEARQQEAENPIKNNEE